MFDIHPSLSGMFMITADPVAEDALPMPVLSGFYAGAYKKHVVNAIITSWWFTADELREIASLLDFMDTPVDRPTEDVLE